MYTVYPNHRMFFICHFTSQSFTSYVIICIHILGTVTVFSFNKALALKKTNFVSRNIGHSDKFALLPLCQPCIQFCLLHFERRLARASLQKKSGKYQSVNFDLIYAHLNE